MSAIKLPLDACDDIFGELRISDARVWEAVCFGKCGIGV
jgi:hypothetical protein